MTMDRHDEHDDLERIAPTLHGLGGRDPFVVPEGFFDRFPHEVQDAIVATGERKGWRALPRPLRRLAIGLPMVALLAGAWWLLRPAPPAVAAELASTPSLDDLSWTEEHELLAGLEETELPSFEETTVELSEAELEAYFAHQDIDLTELIAEQ
jgi:hypothetical protein